MLSAYKRGKIVSTSCKNSTSVFQSKSVVRCGCCEIDSKIRGVRGTERKWGRQGQKGESEFGDIVKMQILIPGVSDEAWVLAFLAPTSWLMCWFMDHLDSQVLGHKWGGISSPLLSLPRSPPYHPWHGTLGCVQCSMCYACSQHRGQDWTMRSEGDGLSPLLILCSLTGNSLAAGAEHRWNQGQGFWPGEVGNERLLVPPLLILVGRSRLTAQETASSAVSFMSSDQITPR